MDESRTNYKYEDVYVPVAGFDLNTKMANGLHHVGYTTYRMKACMCGAQPVLEQYVGDVYIDEDGEKHRNFPARTFVAICPKCELRAIGHGSLEECISVWNAGRFTKDSLMCQTPVDDISQDGCIAISNRVIAAAVEDAVDLVKKKNRELSILHNPMTSDVQREVHYTELKNLRTKLNELQTFFMSSPVMFDKDGEAVLSGIRRILHPELTHQEREKIPLKLTKM